MRRLLFDHWFMEDNRFSISVLNYHVVITPDYSEEKLRIKEVITNSNRDTLVLYFNTLEAATNFAECVVAKSTNLDVINQNYQDLINDTSYVKRLYL